MANRNSARSVKIVVFVSALALAVLCAGCISALAGLTFMPPWIPWTIAVATALGTGMWGRHLWQRITGNGNSLLNYVLHTVMVSLVICSGLYLANRLWATDDGTTADATVTKLYSETRHHTRRVGRNRYVRGEAYQVYFATLRFGNGAECDIPVDYSRYRRMRAGDDVAVGVLHGALGYDVLNPSEIGYTPRRSARPRK